MPFPLMALTYQVCAPSESALEGVADLAHLGTCLLERDEGTDKLILLERVHHLLGQDAGEQDVKAGLAGGVKVTRGSHRCYANLTRSLTRYQWDYTVVGVVGI